MKRREEALMEAEQLGIIVFRALKPKKQQAVVVTPLQSAETGKLYTGQGKTGYYEDMTPAEKNELSVVFDYSTKYVVTPGKVLNIKDDPFHAAQWKWIQRHPYIAMSEEEAKVEPDAVFYVDNPQVKAVDYVSKDKKVTKVKAAIYNAGVDKKKNVAKALGLIGADALSESQVEEWLSFKASELPDTLERLIDPKNASLTKGLVIVKELVTYGIIKRFNTVYKYGGSDGITLGITEDEVALWISDSNNEDTVIAMQMELDEKKGL